MVKSLRYSIPYLYDDLKVSYIQLLVAARKAETVANDTKVVMAKPGALWGGPSSEVKLLTKQISNLMSMIQSGDGK